MTTGRSGPTPGDREHVGYRFEQWNRYEAPNLTPRQKAAALDAFAAEFESVSPSAEPSEGWGDEMAYLCRLIARRHRGEPVGEYVPRWERGRVTGSANNHHEGSIAPDSGRL